MGCYQAPLGEEERDVCLADSFIGKCLFRVSLSAWRHLLLGFHFSVLSLCQLSFTSVWNHRERDKKKKKRVQEDCRNAFSIAALVIMPVWSAPPPRIPWLTCALFRNHQLWGVLPYSRGDGGQEGGWSGDAEERQDAAATRWEEDGKAQSQAPHRWWLWVKACKGLRKCCWYRFLFSR